MKILIVDDEPMIRDTIAEVATEDFDEVVLAEDGTQAIESAAREAPDVVIVDLNLPGMSGLDVCRSIRANASDRPLAVVVLTGSSRDTDLQAAFGAGADDYMVKPFTVAQLRARLRTHALKLGLVENATS